MCAILSIVFLGGEGTEHTVGKERGEEERKIRDRTERKTRSQQNGTIEGGANEAQRCPLNEIATAIFYDPRVGESEKKKGRKGIKENEEKKFLYHRNDGFLLLLSFVCFLSLASSYLLLISIKRSTPPSVLFPSVFCPCTGRERREDRVSGLVRVSGWI